MDNDIKFILQSVIQEALLPIHKELKTLNQRVSSVESNMATKQELTDLSVQMNSRFDTIDAQVYLVKKDVTDIKAKIDMMAGEMPEDITGMLKQVKTKIENKDFDIQALNKRLFQVESTLMKITTSEQ